METRGFKRNAKKGIICGEREVSFSRLYAKFGSGRESKAISKVEPPSSKYDDEG
jgi:hypothetical protein